jgi:hypothetical protein
MRQIPLNGVPTSNVDQQNKECNILKTFIVESEKFIEQ